MKYTVVKEFCVVRGNKVTHYRTIGAEVELSQDEAAELQAAGKVRPTTPGPYGHPDEVFTPTGSWPLTDPLKTPAGQRFADSLTGAEPQDDDEKPKRRRSSRGRKRSEHTEDK